MTLEELDHLKKLLEKLAKVSKSRSIGPLQKEVDRKTAEIVKSQIL